MVVLTCLYFLIIFACISTSRFPTSKNKTHLRRAIFVSRRFITANPLVDDQNQKIYALKKKFINLSNACACLEMVSLTHFAWNHRDVFYARLSSFILLVLVSGGFAKPTNINYLDDCVRTVSTNVLSVNYTDEQGQVSADFFSWTW